MRDNTERSGYPRGIESPMEISILDTNREVFDETIRPNTEEARQKMSEAVQSRLYEKIRLAFGIDMATESPIDIYPVFTPDPRDPSVVMVDFVMAPKRVRDIRLEVPIEKEVPYA